MGCGLSVSRRQAEMGLCKKESWTIASTSTTSYWKMRRPTVFGCVAGLKYNEAHAGDRPRKLCHLILVHVLRKASLEFSKFEHDQAPIYKFNSARKVYVERAK